MKLDTAAAKIKELAAKIGHRNLIIICAVLLIGVAVTLNFVLFQKPDADGMDLAIDMANLSDTGNLSAASNAGTNSASVSADDYFASTTMTRQRARDEAIEVLEAVVANAGTLDEVKDKALSDISKIALDIEREVNIETLVLSKGFGQCVAVINGDLANIIVSTTELLPNEVAQINEIVYEQAGITPSNIKIIEKAIEG